MPREVTQPARDRLPDSDLLDGLSLAGRRLLVITPTQRRLDLLMGVFGNRDDARAALDLLKRERKALTTWA